MQPNIIIRDIIIPSWYTLLITGFFVSAALAIYLKPKELPLTRIDISALAIIILFTSLLGGRFLFMLLHPKSAAVGFAYMGALAFAILTLFLYASVKKVRFFVVSDYIVPFLMLSQVFVRIGCLMAGCCYGRPTHTAFGMVFKTGDGLMRHPTQFYEASLLIFAYTAGRLIYRRYSADKEGVTLCATLALYFSGRFFIEYLRVDSPVVFLNLTLAQISCTVFAIMFSSSALKLLRK